MTLLTLARVRFEFQQVSTPIDAPADDPESSLLMDHHNDQSQLQQTTPNKEDYLQAPEDPKKLVRAMQSITGRSLYVGDREAFFKYI